MQSRARLFGHPVHMMLVVFPLGLLATGAIFDAIGLLGGPSMFIEVAFWLLGAGVVGGLLAAPFGWIDWFALPTGTRARSVGLTHGLGNVVVVLLFAISWLLRRDAPEAPPAAAHVVSFAGFALAGFTAWLGGELVTRLGVGVEPGAHVDAPSSLRSDSRL